MIAIVDYGVNNLQSVRNAFVMEGAAVVVTSDPEEISCAEGIVLPGIGAASAGMKRIRERGLEDVLREVIGRDKLVLAICLGMQLLFEWSEEGDAPCLGILPGMVKLLTGSVKVPHMGWNQVATSDLPMWRGLAEDPYFYFVHSYFCEPSDPGVIAGRTEYGGMFCSAVAAGSIWGTQFHPERSSDAGRRLIRNFIEIVRDRDTSSVADRERSAVAGS